MTSWATMFLVWNPNAAAARVNLLAVLGLLAFGSAQSAHALYPRAELDAAQSETDVGVRELRNQEIVQLRIALGRRLQANRRADLYFRLSQLYFEAYRMEFLLEGRVFEKRIAAGRAESKIDRESSKAILRRGIIACEDLIALKSSYSRLDQVHYFLAVYYGEVGDEKKALEKFTYIAARFPNSPYNGEAHRELGEVAFRKGDFFEAQRQFQTALSKSDSEAQARVLHKLAWTYYRTRNYDRAVDTMKQAIDVANRSGEKLLSLREEALRDMAVFLTETKRPEEAVEYFQKIAGDKSYFSKLLERLGEQFERNGQTDRSAKVYELLLSIKPKDEASFRVMVKLFDLDLKRGHLREAYNRLKPYKNISTQGDSDTAIAGANLKILVRKAGIESHESFRKSGSSESLGIAELFYSAYLEKFLAVDDPKKETVEIQMYLAEVKRELGRASEATELYSKVVSSEDPRYAKEAGALWTASLGESIQKEARGNPVTGQLSKAEKEFISAADRMQDSLGSQPEGREAALRAAQVSAGYASSQKDAIKRSRKLIKQAPSSPQALVAARLLMQLHADRVNPQNGSAADDLKEVVEELRSNSALMEADRVQGEGKIAEQLATQERRLKIGAIADSERSQDFGGAAKGYEEFAASAKDREGAEKAYANAVSSHLKAGDVENAARVQTAWSLRYAKSPAAQESSKTLATLALIKGNFGLSAKLFETLGRDGQSQESLLTAARIYQGDGNAEAARTLWKDSIRLYPQSSLRFSAALLLARSYQTDRLEAEAMKQYEYCEGASDFSIQAECRSQRADYLIRTGKTDEGRKLFSQIASAKMGLSSPYIGYSRYRLANILRTGKKFIATLQLPERQLQRALAERMEFFQLLNKAYQSAVDAGGPWAIAALDSLARWTIEFANDVDEITAPAGTSAVAFEKSLRAVSDPLRRKAVETWLSAYMTAQRQEILSPSIPVIGDVLADTAWLKHGSGQPVRAQGYRGRFRISGIPADGGQEGRGSALRRLRDRLSKDPKDTVAWIDYGNLLWGEGKPLLSSIAYDRALELAPQSAPALNNRAVVLLSGAGQEDWSKSAEAYQLFKQILNKDRSFLAATMNLAILFNYYRLFAQARPLWEEVAQRLPSLDASDGLAIALQGLGEQVMANANFSKAEGQGAKKGRFAAVYHQAALLARGGGATAKKCYSVLVDLEGPELGGFERSSTEYLLKGCKLWKSE